MSSCFDVCITVFGARNIELPANKSECNVFVDVSLIGTDKELRTKKTKDFKWNQTCNFKIKDEKHRDVMVKVKVRSLSKLKSDEVIGEMRLDLNELKIQTPRNRFFALYKRSKLPKSDKRRGREGDICGEIELRIDIENPKTDSIVDDAEMDKVSLASSTASSAQSCDNKSRFSLSSLRHNLTTKNDKSPKIEKSGRKISFSKTLFSPKETGLSKYESLPELHTNEGKLNLSYDETFADSTVIAQPGGYFSDRKLTIGDLGTLKENDTCDEEDDLVPKSKSGSKLMNRCKSISSMNFERIRKNSSLSGYKPDLLTFGDSNNRQDITTGEMMTSQGQTRTQSAVGMVENYLTGIKNYSAEQEAMVLQLMTKDELIKLISSRKQTENLYKRYINDLEVYVDNLTARVMESCPDLLQAPVVRKKPVRWY